MQKGKTYQRLFFDLDNTLTRSRSPIEPAMRALLASLPEDLIVVSGARAEQIQSQLDDLPCYVLAQNGNHALRGTHELWRDTLSETETAEIMAHIASLPRVCPVPDTGDLVEHRGAQISYSIYGHHAPIADKERADPDQAIRRALLMEHPLVSETVEVKIAGTTCLDYTRRGSTKGFNIARLSRHLGWDPATCLYFGDALFPGGNDESVVGVIATEAVHDPKDTYEKLTTLAHHPRIAHP